MSKREFTCEGCGAKFIEYRDSRFCSRKCWKKKVVAWNKGLTSQDERVKRYLRPVNIKEKTCIVCGTKFTNHSLGLFGKAFEIRRFCKKDCWKEYRLRRKLEWKSKSHSFLINEQKEKMQADGYRVISLSGVIPDLIALRDGKVFAVEVETGSQQPNYKKYENRKDYDDVIWKLKPKGVGRQKNHSFDQHLKQY